MQRSNTPSPSPRSQKELSAESEPESQAATVGRFPGVVFADSHAPPDPPKPPGQHARAAFGAASAGRLSLLRREDYL